MLVYKFKQHRHTHEQANLCIKTLILPILVHEIELLFSSTSPTPRVNTFQPFIIVGSVSYLVQTLFIIHRLELGMTIF